MEFLQPIVATVYFIFGGIILFLAYTIIKDDFSQRLNRITGFMLFFAGLGPIFIALGTIIKPVAGGSSPFEESLLYELYYIWELFFPTFLLFSLVFPIDRLSNLKRPKLRYFIFFPHIFHIILLLVFHNPEKVLNLLEVESGEGFSSLRCPFRLRCWSCAWRRTRDRCEPWTRSGLCRRPATRGALGFFLRN